MAKRFSYVTILIASAYLGGAVTLAACWQHGSLSAIVAAPFGGSLAALSAALLLYLLNRGNTGIPSRSPFSAANKPIGTRCQSVP